MCGGGGNCQLLLSVPVPVPAGQGSGGERIQYQQPGIGSRLLYQRIFLLAGEWDFASVAHIGHAWVCVELFVLDAPSLSRSREGLSAPPSTPTQVTGETGQCGIPGWTVHSRLCIEPSASQPHLSAFTTQLSHFDP